MSAAVAVAARSASQSVFLSDHINLYTLLSRFTNTTNPVDTTSFKKEENGKWMMQDLDNSNFPRCMTFFTVALGHFSLFQSLVFSNSLLSIR